MKERVVQVMDDVNTLIKRTLQEFFKVGTDIDIVFGVIAGYKHTIVHGGFITSEKFTEIYNEVKSEVGV